MIYINAKPFIVWNDFYFIQTRGGLSKYQKFAEMTQNKFNTWDTTSCASWGGSSNQQVEDITDNENFPIRVPDGSYLQDTTTSTHAAIEQRQTQGDQIDLSLMQLDELSVMAHNAELSSMFGIGYAHMNTDQGYGSFAALKNCRSSTPLSTAGLSFTSTSSIIEDITMPNDTDTGMPYCGYPTAHGLPISTCEPVPTACFNPLGNEVTNWWEGRRMSNIDIGMTEFELQDGLPRLSEQEFWAHDATEDQPRWNTYSPLTWTSEESGKPIVTIPGASNQQRPWTSASSKISIRTPSGTVEASNNAGATSSIHDAEKFLKVEISTRPPRHALPSSRMGTGHRRATGPATVKKNATAKISKKSWRLTANSTVVTSIRRGSRTVSATTGTHHHESKHETSTTRPNSYLETDPYGFNTFWNDIKVSSEMAGRRELTSVEKDQYLLKARKAGLSYKTIRAQGQFLEAESTLRGRYRSLTKEKKNRVRKPKWTEVDDRLLQEAVERYSNAIIPGTTPKISWKKVAEYIVKKGGTYAFAFATCSKRWDELTKA